MVKMKTNEQIVNIVARTFGISSLIHKMIQNSITTQTDDDLEQYIYLQLLEMDNEKLQCLYDNKELRKFICQIIKNQRNNGKFYRDLQLGFDEFTIKDLPDEETHNWMFEVLMSEIESITFFVTGLTQQQMRYLTSISLVELYYIKQIPKWKLCIEFHIGISTLNLLLRDGKNYLKDRILSIDLEEFKKNKIDDVNNHINYSIE